MTIKSWLTLSAALLALGVAAGAFGAHGLKNRLDPYYMGVFEKAVFYHFIHALGIMLIASIALNGALSDQAANRVCLALLAGIVFFSGSLYLLSITQISWLGAITPIGGTAFILGWVLLCYYLR